MRQCSWLVAALCLGVLAGCQAARFQDALLEMMPRDEAGSQSLLSVLSGLRGRNHGRSGKSDKEDKAAYAAIKFIVPPSESDKFEEEWMQLQKKVMKEEEVDVFSLKKTMLDNLIYWSYGEWDSMRDLRDHFFSRHFEDFSDFVDDHDIKWELRFLENMSEDIERSQRKGRRTATPVKHHHEEEEDDKDAHVLIHYYVPPGESDGFVEAWTDAAEKTIDEKGNYLYSLRKVATDNTRFWVYGSWDSMEDYLDHLNSKHLGKLLDYVADKDIYWHSEPLEDVSNDEDDHKHDDDDDDDDLKRNKQ